MFRQWGPHLSLLLRISIFVIASDLWAGAGEFGHVDTYEPPHYIQGTCIVDVNDPFDPDARLPYGPHQGACIDSRERRSAIRIASESLRSQHFPHALTDDAIIANVYHDNRFWIARVPRNAFETAILQVQYFPLTVLGISHIAHTQILLKCRAGTQIELIEQSTPAEKTPDQLSLNEIVVSIEVVGERGPGFNAFKGLRGYYVQAYRLVSLSEKIEWMITKQKHRVKQWQLGLSPQEITELFQNYLDVATRAGLTTPYHTLRANCSNLLAELVDMPHSKPSLFLRALDSISNLLPFTFRARRILGSRLPDLKAESNSEIQLPVE